MIDDHTVLMLCVRAGSPAAENRVPHSLQMPCHDCRHPLWVSPASMAMLIEKSATNHAFLCARCLKKYKECLTECLMPPSPGVRAELHDAGISDAQIDSLFGIKPPSATRIARRRSAPPSPRGRDT